LYSALAYTKYSSLNKSSECEVKVFIEGKRATEVFDHTSAVRVNKAALHKNLD